MKKQNIQRISKVQDGSIAQKIGIKRGDMLKDINGQAVIDVIDYQYQIYEPHVELGIIDKVTNEYKIFVIDKQVDQDLGLEFENELLDDTMQCKNRCIFCFMDQMPKGLRKTLYIKDDDWRLSFLLGNYITLTNMDNSQLDRILKMKISPLYISVHTTDPNLRCAMMRNKNAGKINDILKKMSDAGIQFNTQIVLCPDINDKDNLDKTISDLSKFYPCMQSIAVVPVGLTKYRQGLTRLRLFTKQEANQTIDQINKWQQYFKQKFGSLLVFAADEFYLIAQRTIPEYAHYEMFTQLENGVGMIAKFKKEFDSAVKKYSNIIKYTKFKKKVNIVTSTAAFDFMKYLMDDISKKIDINVISIKNNFFGDMVNVAGLITGSDMMSQLQDINICGDVLIPNTMLNNDNRFLDDLHLDYISEKLNLTVKAVPIDGKSLLQNIIYAAS